MCKTVRRDKYGYLTSKPRADGSTEELTGPRWKAGKDIRARREEKACREREITQDSGKCEEHHGLVLVEESVCLGGFEERFFVLGLKQISIHFTEVALCSQFLPIREQCVEIFKALLCC